MQRTCRGYKQVSAIFPETMSHREIVYFLSKTMISSIKNNQCDPSNERCQLVESGTITGCGNVSTGGNCVVTMLKESAFVSKKKSRQPNMQRYWDTVQENTRC